MDLFGYRNFMVSMLMADPNAITVRYETKELSQTFKMQKDRQIVDIYICVAFVTFSGLGLRPRNV